MIQIVLKFDPGTGQMQIGTPPGMPAAQAAALLDLAVTCAKQQALAELCQAAREPAVSVPTPAQVRALGK